MSFDLVSRERRSDIKDQGRVCVVDLSDLRLRHCPCLDMCYTTSLCDVGSDLVT